MAGAEFGASVVIGAAPGNTFASTLGRADYQIRALGEAMKKVEIGKRISGEMLRARNELASLRREQRSAAGSSAELAAQVGAAEKRLRGLNEEAREHKIEIGDAAKAHGKFSRQLERGKERAGRPERKRGRHDYRARLKGGVLPLVGAAYTIGRVVSGAMDVEKRQVYLETVINTDDGDTEAAARRAREHAAAYARKSLASEEEIPDIQYNLHSAGLDEAAATAGAEVAHLVATATRGSSDQVAAVIGTTFNNLGDSIAGADPAEKISRIGDVLTQVQQSPGAPESPSERPAPPRSVPFSMGFRPVFRWPLSAVGDRDRAVGEVGPRVPRRRRQRSPPPVPGGRRGRSRRGASNGAPTRACSGIRRAHRGLPVVGAALRSGGEFPRDGRLAGETATPTGAPRPRNRGAGGGDR